MQMLTENTKWKYLVSSQELSSDENIGSQFLARIQVCIHTCIIYIIYIF